MDLTEEIDQKKEIDQLKSRIKELESIIETKRKKQNEINLRSYHKNKQLKRNIKVNKNGKI